MWPRLTHKYRKRERNREGQKAIRKGREGEREKKKKEGDLSSSSPSSSSTYITMPPFKMPVFFFVFFCFYQSEQCDMLFFSNTYIWACACSSILFFFSPITTIIHMYDACPIIIIIATYRHVSGGGENVMSVV